MIFLKKRLIWHMKGTRINWVLAFKYFGAQFILTKVGFKDWIVEILPQLTMSHHNQIHIGLELRWLVFSIAGFIPRPKFHEGLLEEQRILQRWEDENRS